MKIPLRIRRGLVPLFLLFAASGYCLLRAQVPRREPTPNDTLVSVEILSDNRVTFRIYAPKASEVTLRGDWSSTMEPVNLTESEDGVWSVTIEPLVPDFYSYTFSVDGVRTLDPKNPVIKQGIASVDSMFFLPGPEAAFQDNKAVPHGEVRKVWYQSGTLGMQRRLHVYVPPGYDRGRGRYPVFYLLHGGGDEDSGWSTIGRAGFILDNLLAEGKAKPMLLVMPNGSFPRPGNAPPATPGASSNQPPQDWFTKELFNDIIPFIEKNYRASDGRKNRAIAGLSMGGGQTLSVFTSKPDDFGYVAIWSAGLNPQSNADFEKRNEALFRDAERLNRQVEVLSISVGDKDFALAGSKNLADLFEKHGVRKELHISGGGHTWINWRRYLNDFAQRLFR